MRERTPQGHEFHKLEGQPDTFEQGVKDMHEMSKKLDSLVATLHSVVESDESQSQVVQKLKDNAKEAREALQKITGLYRDTANALDPYAKALRTGVQKTGDIASEAERQDKVVDDARHKADTAASTLRDADTKAANSQGSPGADQQAHSDQQTAQTHADDAKRALETAENRMRELGENWDREYATHWQTSLDTAGKIRSVQTHSPARDHKFLDFLQGLVKVLGWVALALVVAALVVGTGGGILALLATIASVAAFVGTGILYANGRASFGELVLSGLAVVPFAKMTQIFKIGDNGLQLLSKGEYLGKVGKGFKEMYSAKAFNEAAAKSKGLYQDAMQAYRGGLPGTLARTPKSLLERGYQALNPKGIADAFARGGNRIKGDRLRTLQNLVASGGPTSAAAESAMREFAKDVGPRNYFDAAWKVFKLEESVRTKIPGQKSVASQVGAP